MYWRETQEGGVPYCGTFESNLFVDMHKLLAAEVAAITSYFRRVVMMTAGGTPEYPDLAEGETISVPSSPALLQELSNSPELTAVVLNGVLNCELDIDALLHGIHSRISRRGRVIAVMYSPYLRWILRFVTTDRIFSKKEPYTFITATDLRNMARMAGFEVTRVRTPVVIPWRMFGVGTILNRLLAAIPFVRRLSLAWVVVLRPIKAETTRPSLSIIIPARNERGNIENALTRLPDFGGSVEVLFVEGHSTDGTWDEIQRVASLYGPKYSIVCLRQRGVGKCDAVRLGASQASGDLIAILDADLTMPPEMLIRFYDAWRLGYADFINGNRLMYPMEHGAMRFLNRLGNVFFAKALSYVLDTRIGDSLCGTKLFSRDDYYRFVTWRQRFGDFDPFGDFELLFPACSLGLGVVDIPIQYRDRMYGSTKIHRFYHGLLLLRMTIFGFFRLRCGRSPRP